MVALSNVEAANKEVVRLNEGSLVQGDFNLYISSNNVSCYLPGDALLKIW